MLCNTCGSTDHQFLFSNIETATPRIKRPPKDVYICKQCGQVFLDISHITAEDLATYYSTFNPFEVPTELPEEHKALRKDQMAWLLSHVEDPKNLKAIDIGCGAGFVLKLMKKSGMDANGVEFSPKMAKHIQSNFGIPCLTGGFDLSNIPTGFDVASCITVLEHVYDPSALLKGVHSCLKDGGLFYLEVPDAEFPRSDMIPDHLAFEHIHHWTERTLSRLLQNNNFEIVAVSHVVNGAESGNPEAVLRIMSRKADAGTIKKEIENDFEKMKKVLTRYKESHNEYKSVFASKIERILTDVGDEKLAIYCGGQHTVALLTHFRLSPDQVEVIYDGDQEIAGTNIFDIPVRHSSEIPESDIRHYLLSTTNHERPIYNFLKDQFASCKVYGLYQDFDTPSTNTEG